MGPRQMKLEEVGYLLRRHEQETAAASHASNRAVRVAHLELAFRYSLAAANACPISTISAPLDPAQVMQHPQQGSLAEVVRA